MGRAKASAKWVTGQGGAARLVVPSVSLRETRTRAKANALCSSVWVTTTQSPALFPCASTHFQFHSVL